MCIEMKEKIHRRVNYKFIFVRNILTAIARRMTPKNFRMTKMPECPKIRSNQFKLFNAIKMMSVLMRIANRILY